jgi:hypothetical protein
MPESDSVASKIARFARKVGSVSAATAALLAQTDLLANESSLVKGILQRTTVAAVSADLADVAKKLPPPLVLTPSESSGPVLLAGHRSHSSHSSHNSHSSHRSHASGSGHASHYSATVAPVTPPVVSRGTANRGSGVSSPSVSAGRTDPKPSIPEPNNGKNSKKTKNATAVKSEPYQPPTDIDLSDPLERFELTNVVHTQKDDKAFILDRLDGKRRLYAVKAKIDDDYEVLRVDFIQQIAVIRKKGDEPITLKKAPTKKRIPAIDSDGANESVIKKE